LIDYLIEPAQRLRHVVVNGAARFPVLSPRPGNDDVKLKHATIGQLLQFDISAVLGQSLSLGLSCFGSCLVGPLPALRPLLTSHSASAVRLSPARRDFLRPRWPLQFPPLMASQTPPWGTTGL
jgi:hypothetical protein